MMRIVREYFAMLLAIVVLVFVFQQLSPTFFSVTTMRTITNSIPDLTVVAVGMTLVLVLGGIDLSVGSVLAFCAAIVGVLVVDLHWPIPIAMLISMFAGTLCGFINGIISVRFRVPSFIVTLGMLEIARGAAYLTTNSQTKYVGSSIEWLSVPMSGLLVSPAFLIAIAVVCVGQFLLSQTVLGRMTVAIGTNTETVRMSGVNHVPYSVTIYSILGFLCALGALFQISRLSTSDPNGAIGMELSAIAACVIGGTSLRGGKGSVVNTFFGVLFVAILQAGLAQIGTSEPLKRIITGGVIIAAVLVDELRKRD